MSDARYDVIFTGELLDGFELQDVKANFARLFKQAEDKVERIFSQSRVTIKSNLEKAAAEKYQQALTQAGARVVLQLKQAAAPNLSIEPLAESAVAAQAPKATPAQGAESYGIANVVAPGREIQAKASAVPSRSDSDAASESDSRGQDANAVANGESRSLPFRFSGNGGEYFKIWIVNIFLTIITLGIYSAWAKVRNNRYFYSNTQLDGSTFEYLAKPLNILKGRIIAVVFFLLYSGAGSVSPVLGGILGLLMVIVLPWLVVKSLSFNARNSAYRNITFGFNGDIMGALKAFIGWPLLGALSLGLLMPLAFYKQQQYMVNGYRYGTTNFDFDAGARDYFMIFLAALGILIGGLLLSSLLSLVFPPIAAIGMVIVYLYVFAFFTVRSKNLLYNSTTLALHGFSSRLQLNSFAWLFFSNTLFTLVTIGLYIPWAKVRTANYMAEHLSFDAVGNLDSFVADEQEQVSALGEELGDVFDFDIGL